MNDKIPSVTRRTLVDKSETSSNRLQPLIAHNSLVTLQSIMAAGKNNTTHCKFASDI